MKRILYFLIIMSIISCFLFRSAGIELTIVNKSEFPIGNVEFTTSERLNVLKFDEIESNQVIRGYLEMKNNKTDA